jgi:1-acyl-sn-glycerol-3-phosphate acyltransferase
MSQAQKLVIHTFKVLTNLLCRIDAKQLKSVPQVGPMIVVTNHTNILEIPIIYSQLQPRKVTGFVAAERWEKGWSRWLLETCNAIPVRRGEADIGSIKRGVKMLGEGYFVVVMPEGTRSGDGRLQKAHPGIVTLALHCGAPLIPIVFYGGERYKENLHHLRRTDFHLGVGRCFEIHTGDVKINREIRQQILTEVMFQIASLLPEQNRGEYQNIPCHPPRFLEFT